MTVTELLVSCLCDTISGTEPALGKKMALSDQTYQELYMLSAKHDLAHLVCDALQKNNLLPSGKCGAAFQKQKDLALYRYIQQSDIFAGICEIFEDSRISYIPLKGAVIRDLYPESWMRTSCDIDILVHEEDLEQAASVLADRLNFRTEGKNYHDISLYAPNGVHLELHFHIKESAGALDRVLARVWDYAEPCSSRKMGRRLTHEFLLYHHLAHMSYHFVTGGCGLRPFLDCYLLQKQLEWDQSVLNGLLKEGGIKKFADRAFDLSQKLFGPQGAALSEAEEKLLDYILDGGVYGSKENHIRSQQARRGSAAKNMARRIWLPYETLKNYYASLDGRRYLLPVYEVRRWMRIIFKEGKIGSSIHELKDNLTVQEDERNGMKQILEDLGLTGQYHDA